MSLKLTGGELRGRLIRAPQHERTRPTQARLRQALFNSLQARVPDARVLDLFAGSGALGFEALSRGASRAVFVEQAKPVMQLISRNAEDLGVSDRVQALALALERGKEGGRGGAWKRILELGPFDLILADPPYDAGWETELLENAPWSELLAPDGVFCLEWGALKSVVVEAGKARYALHELPDRVPFLVKIREKHYGDSVLSTYERDPVG